jgi:hypothetical protein
MLFELLHHVEFKRNIIPEYGGNKYFQNAGIQLYTRRRNNPENHRLLN